TQKQLDWLLRRSCQSLIHSRDQINLKEHEGDDRNESIGQNTGYRNHHVREVFVAPTQRIHWCWFAPAKQWNGSERSAEVTINKHHDRNQQRANRIGV